MRRERETSEYAAMVRRMVRRYGERVADESPEDLAEMLAMRDTLEAAIAVAVAGQRTRFSWGDLGKATGLTRQAVRQRYAPKVAS